MLRQRRRRWHNIHQALGETILLRSFVGNAVIYPPPPKQPMY